MPVVSSLPSSSHHAVLRLFPFSLTSASRLCSDGGFLRAQRSLLSPLCRHLSSGLSDCPLGGLQAPPVGISGPLQEFLVKKKKIVHVSHVVCYMHRHCPAMTSPATKYTNHLEYAVVLMLYYNLFLFYLVWKSHCDSFRTIMTQNYLRRSCRSSIP